MGIPVGRQDLEHTFGEIQNRDIVGAATKVIDGDLLVVLLVEAVGQRRRGRLVDDPEHLKAGDSPGIFGGGSLAVIEVGRNGDDRFIDLFAEVRFGIGLHLGENHRRDFRRAVPAVTHLNFDATIVRPADLIGNQLQITLHGRIIEATAHETLH